MAIFNCIKLKNDLKNKKATLSNISRDLNVPCGGISGLLNGIENEKLLNKICNYYKLNKSDYYMGDFTQPEYMRELRYNLQNIQNELNYEQIAKLANVSHRFILNVINRPSFICHVNRANKINSIITSDTNFNNLTKNILKSEIGENSYNKLTTLANENFSGNIYETIKFLIDLKYLLLIIEEN